MKLDDLNYLIPRYAINKESRDGYKKLCDKENATIKAIMKNFAVQNYVAGEYKASYSVSKRETMNEEMLLQIFDTAGAREDLGIIKTKEYIDYDALENAIYNGLIPKDMLLEMDKAKEVKEIVTLRVDKVKKQEEDD